jgi:hypothetical protein
VLYGLKVKEFMKLDEIIPQAIREVFLEEGIKEEVIEQYLQQATGIAFSKTKDRTSVARMNNSCESIYFYEDLIDRDSLIQTKCSIRTNRYLVGNGKNDYIYPNEEMYKELEILDGGNIFSSKAVDMIITLNLEKHKVWRRLVVPVNITFSQLHEIIQIAFGWKNSHLHEFFIYNHETTDTGLSPNHPAFHKEGYKPILNLVAYPDVFEYENDIATELDSEVSLLEYLSSKIKYNYDPGDNWQHYIDMVQVIPDFEYNHPVCIEGEGNTPPEGVGGEAGYESFLEIIADPKHPDYLNTMKWSIGQGYLVKFNLPYINRQLKLEF